MTALLCGLSILFAFIGLITLMTDHLVNLYFWLQDFFYNAVN